MSKKSKKVFMEILKDDLKTQLLINFYNKWINNEKVLDALDWLGYSTSIIAISCKENETNNLTLRINNIPDKNKLFYTSTVNNVEIHEFNKDIKSTFLRNPYARLYFVFRLIRNYYGQQIEGKTEHKNKHNWYWYHNRYIIQYLRSVTKSSKMINIIDSITINRFNLEKLRRLPSHMLLIGLVDTPYKKDKGVHNDFVHTTIKANTAISILYRLMDEEKDILKKVVGIENTYKKQL